MALTTLAAYALGVTAAGPASAVADDYMPSGSTLVAGSELTSPSGQYTLRMQTDGNLVEYHGSTARWATNTFGSGNRVVMQTNGNLVVFNGSTPSWQSGTGGTNVELMLQDDGNVVLYQGNLAIWAITSNMTTSGVSSRLTAGQSKSSPSGQYQLKMQTDGNFVLYNGSAAIFASDTYGTNNYVQMQPDGNLVVYNNAGSPLWDSGTTGDPGAASLDVQNDGNLVMYEATGPIWAKTSTVSTSPVSNKLTAGESKYSTNGQYRLTMQTDGNLVEYKGSTAVWWTGTAGTGSGNYMTMQGDGNLVVYNSSGQWKWQSQTSGHPGAAELDVQNDGNVVIYEVSGPLWSRLTGVIGGTTQPEQAAVSWAQSQVGIAEDQNRCLSFVNQAWGNTLPSKVNITWGNNTYPDNVWGHTTSGSTGVGEPTVPGALVFYAAGSGGDGGQSPSHVEIYIGNNTMVSTQDAYDESGKVHTEPYGAAARELGWWLPDR